MSATRRVAVDVGDMELTVELPDEIRLSVDPATNLGAAQLARLAVDAYAAALAEQLRPQLPTQGKHQQLGRDVNGELVSISETNQPLTRRELADRIARRIAGGYEVAIRAEVARYLKEART
jgi:hypothetical protein